MLRSLDYFIQICFGKFYIYDISGKLVKSGKTTANKIELDNSFINGTYFLHYEKGTKKFSKN